MVEDGRACVDVILNLASEGFFWDVTPLSIQSLCSN